LSGPEPSLDDFKARLPLAEIVGRYVKLTRRGREHLGLCPFHKEKTPSFNVVEEKGFYHCFGCGAHGTAIDFVMAVEGLSFGDALTRLADLTGIAAPRRSVAVTPERSQRLFAANAAAASWFQAQLLAPSGREALAYLERRGLDRTIIRGFELGYAPNDRQPLRAALRSQGFGEPELVAAGLLKAEDGGEPFAHFRHRLMFPIADERGRIVGFGGRALGEARAKYLNTPETEIFHKGDLLYNLHRAARPARERHEVVLAEGYMDVIALSQAGVTQAVAPLGTAVTERQLAALWRLDEAPIVCLDGDRAGLAAAMRAAERALPVVRGGQSLRFAILPDGEDPDSFLRRHGAEALRSVLSKAHTLSQMIWRLETRGKRFETPEARAALSRRLRSLARLAADADLRGSLLDEFRALQEEFMAPRMGRRRAEGRRSSAWEGVGAARLEAGLADPQLLAEVRLVVPVVQRPSMLVGLEETFDQVNFDSPLVEKLRNEILFWYTSDSLADRGELKDYLRRFPELENIVKMAGENVTTGDLVQPEYEKMLFSYIRKGHISMERNLLSAKAAEHDYSGVASSFQNILDLQSPQTDTSSFATDLQADTNELDRTLRELTTKLRAAKDGESDGR
jgi:DNA primase